MLSEHPNSANNDCCELIRVIILIAVNWWCTCLWVYHLCITSWHHWQLTCCAGSWLMCICWCMTGVVGLVVMTDSTYACAPCDILEYAPGNQSGLLHCVTDKVVISWVTTSTLPVTHKRGIYVAQSNLTTHMQVWYINTHQLWNTLILKILWNGCVQTRPLQPILIWTLRNTCYKVVIRRTNSIKVIQCKVDSGPGRGGEGRQTS